MRVALELADIFRRYGPAYRQKYARRIPSSHFKAMRAVEQCRTPALGGQVYRCPNCEQVLMVVVSRPESVRVGIDMLRWLEVPTPS